MKVLVTGGLGFIGTNLINFLLQKDLEIVSLDKSSYASHYQYHQGLIKKHGNYSVRKLDLCDLNGVTSLMDSFKPNLIFHLAAESHVDNSIDSPGEFIHSNILGTYNLLEVVRKQDNPNIKLIHVSTDEVFGSTLKGKFSENSKYDPSSPYSASKAASDHLVSAWNKTYDINMNITNCSNNYGPFQNKEKLIPKVIWCLLNNIQIPVYGNGSQVRDWLYVEDHVSALWSISQSSLHGETFNIGTNNEISNIELVQKICDIYDVICGAENSKKLITHVKDRLGHDQRYAIDATKIRTRLSWKPNFTFENSIINTVKWYIDYFRQENSG